MLQQLDDIHINLPVIFEPPMHNFFLQMCYQPDPVNIVPTATQAIEAMQTQGIRPIIFTDGSCFSPEHYPLAAWAIVVGLDITEQQKCDTILRGFKSGVNLSSFLTVAVGRCNKQQSIDRAELEAMVVVHEHWMTTQVVTDSAYAMDCWKMVTTQDDLTILHSRQNADLLIRLYHANRGANNVVTKVASHTLEKGQNQPQDPYLTIGNAVVDAAAKAANQFLNPILVQTWDDNKKTLDHCKQLRRQHLRLLVELQPLRARLEHSEKAKQRHKQDLPLRIQPGKSYLQSLTEWDPATYIVFDLYWPAGTSLCGPWGEECAFELIQYWNKLKWSDDSSHEINIAGVTWTELALDFLLTQRVHIPTNPPKIGTPRHLESDNNKLRTNGWAFCHLVKSFFYLARWLDKKLDGAMFQGLEQGTVTSLQKQGASNRHHGIRSRPPLCNQDMVISEVTQQRRHAGGRFSGLKWPFDDSFWSHIHKCE